MEEKRRKPGLWAIGEVGGKVGRELSGPNTSGSWKWNELRSALIAIMVSGRVFALPQYVFPPQYLIVYPYSPSVGRFMENLVWSREAMNSAGFGGRTRHEEKKVLPTICVVGVVHRLAWRSLLVMV